VTDYPRIDVTVDVVALAPVDGEPHVLVVRRGNPPFQDQWALPGGFLEVDEDFAPGAARELAEETGVELDPDRLTQLGAYGAPDRDPRGRTISIAHVVRLDRAEQPQGGSDASDARWRPVAELLDGELAFDHDAIIRDALAALPSPHADPG
jgi:8-oxo-dGTP diphosphatase